MCPVLSRVATPSGCPIRGKGTAPTSDADRNTSPVLPFTDVTSEGSACAAERLPELPCDAPGSVTSIQH